jgi:DNA-binding response OmpR family regulator/anti-sigma regulatory factor (Ser/Thr protein kinase)
MSNVLAGRKAVEILIADDSPTQLQRLQLILEGHGYRVTATANGRLALEAARCQQPALIVSDVVMPEMDGYELCRQVKENPQLSAVPVILVTTLSDPQDVIRGLECRADNFILKPYEAEHLLRRIEFVLVNSEMRRNDLPGMGLEIVFGGHKHFITADRLQILNLLLSTYEAAMERNQELSATRDALRQTNLKLEDLTRDLEGRVLARTRELESSNKALSQAQQALIQQERLRALGQMASGIAHDINNAISPIALYTESMLERERGLSAEGRSRLVTIQRAIDDVAQTVGRMREFYRPQDLKPQLANLELNTLVRQVMELTRARWNDQPQRRGVMIELRAELLPDLPEILGADHEIRDAITNLIFNAVDASPNGGVITIRSSVLRPQGQNDPASRRVQLEVIDPGVGMDEETRRRCLEPFFTTKGERGTGLGLAMVFGMAQRHGATLEIDSRPGAGTTMRLLFPISAQTLAATARVRALQLPVSSLRILVVDDEPALRDSLREILQEEGHQVTLTAGGQEGIDAFRTALRGSEPFDAVITDLGMPYVDGRQVAAAVRAMEAHVPIILLTGWGQRMAAENEVPEVNRVLAKPPRLRDLRATLAELTAAPGAAALK